MPCFSSTASAFWSSWRQQQGLWRLKLQARARQLRMQQWMGSLDYRRHHRYCLARPKPFLLALRWRQMPSTRFLVCLRLQNQRLSCIFQDTQLLSYNQTLSFFACNLRPKSCFHHFWNRSSQMFWPSRRFWHRFWTHHQSTRRHCSSTHDRLCFPRFYCSRFSASLSLEWLRTPGR